MFKTVTLTDGSSIELSMTISFLPEMFIRLNDRMVMGIVKYPKGRDTAIYIFRERDGQYFYLGDIGFMEEEDDFVLWAVCTSSGRPDSEANKKIARFLQCEGRFRVNYEKFLSTIY